MGGRRRPSLAILMAKRVSSFERKLNLPAVDDRCERCEEDLNL